MDKINIFSKIFKKILFITLLSFGILFFIFFSYYFWQLKFGKSEKITEINSNFNTNMRVTNNSKIKTKIEGWEKMINSYNPKKGEESSQIKIIAFVDFSCDYSKEDYKKILNIQNKFPISQIIFKYSPILNNTENSYNTALASACANEQNNFWQYYEKLFQNNNHSKDNLYKIADNLSLNTEQFQSCFENEKYKNIITKDLKDFSDFELRGTPTYIINGNILEGSQPEKNWTKIILQILNN